MAEAMTKQDIPRSSGVFKPVGHVLMVLDDAPTADRAIEALHAAGFGLADTIVYSSEEMAAQCEEDIKNAGLLASLGAEISLAKKHLELARENCCFIVVFAPNDDLVKLVAEVAEQVGARFAQFYGRLSIEELVSSPESPRA